MDMLRKFAQKFGSIYKSLRVFIKRMLYESIGMLVIVPNADRFIGFIVIYLFQNGFHVLLLRINGFLNNCDLYIQVFQYAKHTTVG